MSKKVFLIVEGPSDEVALTKGLEHHCAPLGLDVRVIRADIFTTGRENTNIINDIGKVVTEYLRKTKLKKKDIAYIAHITDLDGCYLEDDHLRVDKNYPFNEGVTWMYKDGDVITKDERKRQDLSTRNILKSKRTSIMAPKRKIADISYGLFYMAANLDHVIHNLPHCSDVEKENLNSEFEDQVLLDFSHFELTLCSVDLAPFDTLNESWDFIKNNNNSACRYTNIKFLIEILNNLESTV